MPSAAPQLDLDLFAEEALADPYPLYDAIREAGPAVWLPQLEVYALARYAETRAAARDWEIFSSARGVALNATVNDATGGVAAISCDPPLHEEMRRVLRRPLMADAVRELEPRLRAEAETFVEALVEAGRFDAVTDLAQHLPLEVISRLVGIPEAGREQMLSWATATFDAMGPDNERSRDALPVALGVIVYAMTEAVPPNLAPGGWAQMVYDSADRGELAPEHCAGVIGGYLAPSLDTTINGMGNAIMLLGEHPDQWDLLRADPTLIPSAVNEVLRLESPVQIFTRSLTCDHAIGDVDVPAGSRVALMYGAANRDERRWPDPTRFDVRRERSAGHLAFGFGPHACVGSALARLEMRVILEALVKRVKRFETGAMVRGINQTLRGLASLEVVVTERS